MSLRPEARRLDKLAQAVTAAMLRRLALGVQQLACVRPSALQRLQALTTAPKTENLTAMPPPRNLAQDAKTQRARLLYQSRCVPWFGFVKHALTSFRVPCMCLSLSSRRKRGIKENDLIFR